LAAAGFCAIELMFFVLAKLIMEPAEVAYRFRVACVATVVAAFGASFAGVQIANFYGESSTKIVLLFSPAPIIAITAVPGFRLLSPKLGWFVITSAILGLIAVVQTWDSVYDCFYWWGY
jgi:hypothetical protein